MDRTCDGEVLVRHDPTGADRVSVLVVNGLSKSFGHRIAVNNVGFELSKHELVAVLGPSGAGKTTLFRCVTGIQKADAGHVAFKGIGIEQLQLQDRRLIAVVFQQFNLVRRLTALDNVLAGRLGYIPMWRGLLRRFERADTLKAFASLERVGMLEHASQRADTLSGGQQQRVAIARALAQEPRLIVADEPVASLDPSAAAGILQLLKDIARTDGVSVICSLHQVDYARAYADRIIGLAHGHIVVDAATPSLGDADYAAIYEPGSRQTADLATADARGRVAPDRAPPGASLDLALPKP